MDFLRRTLQQIKIFLSKMTISQRLLVATLAVVGCISFLFLVQYAGQREMVPLLDQPFTGPSLAQIQAKLDGWEQTYTMQGDRILVPRAEQKQLLAKLAYAGALPEDTSIGWSTLLADSDIWTPESVRQNKALIIKQTELARIIAKFPGVEKAQVIINEGGKRTLRNTQPTASASVMVQLTSSAPPVGRLAVAIGALVSGSTPNLKRENVQVVADGKLVPVAAVGEETSTDYLSAKAQYETLYRQKILDILPPATEALVQVDVTLQNTKLERRTTKYDEEGKGSWLARVDETTREQTGTNSTPLEEPGVAANVSSQAPPAAAGSNESSEEGQRKNQAFAGSTETIEQTDKGGVKDITATVNVSLGYFEGMAKQGAAEKQAPDAAQVQAVMDREVTKLKKMVMAAIGLVDGPENQDKVVVNPYWAGGGIANRAGEGGVVEAKAGAGGAAAGTMWRYGKHVAVSALAVVSLLMALMMVRKSASPAPTVGEEGEVRLPAKRPPEALGLEDSVVPAEGGGGLLAGLELDESSVQAQQVLEQIKEMVKDSPDQATALVSKWINQSE